MVYYYLQWSVCVMRILACVFVLQIVNLIVTRSVQVKYQRTALGR